MSHLMSSQLAGMRHLMRAQLGFFLRSESRHSANPSHLMSSQLGFFCTEELRHNESTWTLDRHREENDDIHAIGMFLGEDVEHCTACGQVQMSPIAQRAVSPRGRPHSCRPWFHSNTSWTSNNLSKVGPVEPPRFSVPTGSCRHKITWLCAVSLLDGPEET